MYVNMLLLMAFYAQKLIVVEILSRPSVPSSPSVPLAALEAYVGGPWRPGAEKFTKPEREPFSRESILAGTCFFMKTFWREQHFR